MQALSVVYFSIEIPQQTQSVASPLVEDLRGEEAAAHPGQLRQGDAQGAAEALHRAAAQGPALRPQGAEGAARDGIAGRRFAARKGALREPKHAAARAVLPEVEADGGGHLEHIPVAQGPGRREAEEHLHGHAALHLPAEVGVVPAVHAGLERRVRHEAAVVDDPRHDALKRADAGQEALQPPEQLRRVPAPHPRGLTLGRRLRIRRVGVLLVVSLLRGHGREPELVLVTPRPAILCARVLHLDAAGVGREGEPAGEAEGHLLASTVAWAE